MNFKIRHDEIKGLEFLPSHLKTIKINTPRNICNRCDKKIPDRYKVLHSFREILYRQVQTNL